MTSPMNSSRAGERPMVLLPVDDVAVVLGLLDLLCPPVAIDDGDAVHALAARFRTRLSVAIAAAVEAPREVHSA